MTYFPDLTQYHYHRPYLLQRSLNIGWLAGGVPYPQGDVPEEFVRRLWIRCEDPIVESRGWHWCDFCGGQAGQIVLQTYGDKTMRVGNAEIRVWGADGKVYAAPNMIIHYIIQHRYRPPDEFIQAVLKGSMPESPEYDANKMDFERRLEKFTAWVYLRRTIGEWNRKLVTLLNENSTKEFAKREFVSSGRRLELDAASPPLGGVIEIAVVMHHLWPGAYPFRDVGEYCRKISRKAEAYRQHNPNGLFFAIVFCWFADARQSLAHGLQDAPIDGLFFVDREGSPEDKAIRLLLEKAGCLAEGEP